MQVVHPLTREELTSIWKGSLPTAADKGYPALFDQMSFWSMLVDGEAIAYTGSLVMPDRAFAFVGNTYVRRDWRNKGVHRHLLAARNGSPILRDLPKVTLLNPIEESTHEGLVSVVTSLGYRKVICYADVSDIMSRDLYEQVRHKQVWRVDRFRALAGEHSIPWIR